MFEEEEIVKDIVSAEMSGFDVIGSTRTQCQAVIELKCVRMKFVLLIRENGPCPKIKESST